MIHIQIAPEVEARLAAEAQARGVALDRYIAEKLSGGVSVADVSRGSIQRAIENIRTLRKGNLLAGLSLRSLIHEGRRH